MFYYTAVPGFALEKSTYGAALIANDISDLFSIDENTIKDFTLSFAFSRIVGFFLAPAMLSNWFHEICAVVDDRDQEFSADAELVNWYKYWQRLSDFVYSGGVTKVSGFDPLTLEDARKNLVILKTTDIEPVPKNSPWNNPGVEEFPNKNMTKQAEEWTRRYGDKDVGKDLVKKNGYHTSAGIIIPAAAAAPVRFRATIISPTAPTIPTPAAIPTPTIPTPAAIPTPAILTPAAIPTPNANASGPAIRAIRVISSAAAHPVFIRLKTFLRLV